MVALSNDKRLQVIVIGRVQGVGFRMFVQDHAERLGLVGFVRNDWTDRRRVEVVAEGAQAELEELLRHLQEGPGGARVEDIQVFWDQAQASFTSFKVTT
ncbi:MAG: acylphosphatase [Chloroflexi bacterium]|nr:acylphosphatase [Chloroflexota bacterium]